MEEVISLKIDDVIPNPNQPRKLFDEQALQELADSIKADGLQEPILVRPKGDKYEVVQGERRWRAHKLAGMDTIPAKVRDVDDETAFHLAVIENIQREQLTPIEEAQAFQRYAEMGYTHEQIAKKVSKSRTYVTTRLRLLKLMPTLQDWIAKGVLTEGHAKQLLKIESFINRFLEDAVTCYDTPFEYIQWRFHNDYWFDVEKNRKITVNDVKRWVDDCRYFLIRCLVDYVCDNGNRVASIHRGLAMTAEVYCTVFGLKLENLTREDIEFANKYELELYKKDFDKKFRPWMIDRFWDQMEISIFREKSIKWEKPRPLSDIDLKTVEMEDKSLDEITKEIKVLKEKTDAATRKLSEMTGKTEEQIFKEIVSCDT